MSTKPVIVWFRHDLRLADHPALQAAVQSGQPVIPLFIWAPHEEGDWPPGAASCWWLHQSLHQLNLGLTEKGSRLIIRTGDRLAVLREIVDQTGADTVFWCRRYEPDIIERDRVIKKFLQELNIGAKSMNGSLLFEPWTIQTGTSDPYKVFTPFWKNCQQQGEPAPPLPSPERIPAPQKWPDSLPLDALELEPKVDWAGGIRASWTPGFVGAQQELERFLDESLAEYKTQRDYPSQPGTSRLSPHLHFGEISPGQIWQAVRHFVQQEFSPDRQHIAEPYLRQLGWREFAYHLLFHFPDTTNYPLRPEFAAFPWVDDTTALRAWQKGRTGYPLVDAGMRELWATGWMHNRVRMTVASFLVKDLRIHWLAGARWFWDTLVDADLANNTLGWQWTAGCGADAAPYFRIFNPVRQSERFDGEGDYIRLWVPELANLPNKWIHAPWEAPADILTSAGVELGTTYPRPIVDHGQARQAALAGYERVKAAKK